MPKSGRGFKYQYYRHTQVLLMAKQKGIIHSVKDVINLLNNQSFRFSNNIVNEILKLAGEA